MKIEAIFFDVDGTLLEFNTHAIRPAVIKALQKASDAGVKLFIATGRHCSKIAFLEDVVDFTGFVTVNGQVCYNKKEDIYLHALPAQDVLILNNKMEELGIPCCYLLRNETWVNRLDDCLSSLEGFFDLSNAKEKIIGKEYTMPVYQMVANITPEQEHFLLELAQGAQTTRWNPQFVDIVPKGGNKSVGIEKVLEYYGIKKENVMAFGDGSNDKEMLAYVGLGVAMGNAAPDVQAVADYVTDSVAEDGIVTALQHFGIIE